MSDIGSGAAPVQGRQRSARPRGAIAISRPVQQQPSSSDRGGDAALYRALVDSASDAVMAFDLDGRITVWNSGCAQLFGWTRDEMLGKSAVALVPEDRRDELERVMRTLAGHPEPAAIETLRLHKSGHVLPISCRVSPILDEHGHAVGVSAVVRENSREIALRQQLEHTRHLAEARFQQSVVPQATLSPAGVVLDCNPALCALTGYDAKQLLGRPFDDLLADGGTGVGVAVGAPDTADLPLQQPQLLQHADGHRVETRVSIFGVRDDVSGAVLRLEAVIEDVTAAAAAQRELGLHEARWESLELYSADVAMLLDRDALLRFVTGSATRHFGYRPEDVLGADGFSFVHPDDEPGVRALWDATVAAPGTTAVFEARVLHLDGSWRWAEATLTNRLLDPDVAAVVVNLTDISQRKSAEAVLEELAGTDLLTGLATRAPLMATLDAAFAAGRAAQTAVALIDVDRLKLINDVHGHRGGDDALREVAVRLSSAAADRVVARVGGDEFAVVLADVADISDVFEAVAGLLGTLEEPFALGDATVQITASAGAALGPAGDSGALLASAEAALVTAKQGLTGPMHVMRSEPSSSTVARARLIEDLRRGIAQDELVVHFQPVVSITDGRPVAAEALVRWQHPDKGLLSPAAFMTAAEDSGLVVQIGEAVLTQACGAAVRWNQGRGRGAAFPVAVNVSGCQLAGGVLVAAVRAALSGSGASASTLMLEVTESGVMSDLDAAVRTLQELRDLGASVAVDDFGTGYASLTYLKQFPATALKIDRSFVSGLGTNDDDAAIVSSVISLGRAMGLQCIAEGVETEQQRLILQALGCAYGQGFLWSAAVPADALTAWLGRAGSASDADSAPRPSSPRAAGRAGPRRPRPSSAATDADPQLLQRVLELSGEGASLATIAAALNAEQLLTAQGRRWTARSVAVMLATRQRF